MELSEIFDNLSDKITQLSIYQRAINNMTKEELRNLNNYYKSIEDKPVLLGLPKSLDRMFFSDAKTGEMRKFGYRRSSVEDRIKAVVFHKNKQYQWLLAEAYEVFADYIKNAYAYTGLLDKNLWSLRDFGNISLPELSNKGFIWFRSQVDKIRDIDNILNQFRKVFTDIDRIETNNKLDINLKLAIILIENLRHIIVHKGGVIEKLEDFIIKIIKKAELYNNNRPRDDHIKFIKQYFGSDEYENNITLLEVRVHFELPFDIHFHRFDSLIGYLMSYSFIVKECLEHIKRQ